MVTTCLCHALEREDRLAYLKWEDLETLEDYKDTGLSSSATSRGLLRLIQKSRSRPGSFRCQLGHQQIVQTQVNVSVMRETLKIDG